MTEQAAAIASAETDAQKLTAVQAESQRRTPSSRSAKRTRSIRASSVDGSMKGLALTQISDEILQVVEERTKHKPSGPGDARSLEERDGAL
jgi:hypothetical protein